jgi:formylglycine-generating enzyme required for sulfatase activity
VDVDMSASQPNDRQPKLGDLIVSPTTKLRGQPNDREPKLGDLVASPTMKPSNLPPTKTFQFEYATVRKSLFKAIAQRFTKIPPKSAMSRKSLIKMIVQQQSATSSLKIRKRSGQAEYFQEDLGNGVLLDMVRIPPGELRRGEADNRHQVLVPEFWMGKFVVTQRQWAAIADLPKVNRNLAVDPSDFKGADLPVEQVSWSDATEFCDRLSQKTGNTYSLPSEVEWQYACHTGSETPISTDLANYGRQYGGTSNVGSFPPNAFGLYDVYGNVWEWCERAPDAVRVQLHENAATGEGVLHGGSWDGTVGHCRQSLLAWDSSFSRYYIGFRVVYSPMRTDV